MKQFHGKKTLEFHEKKPPWNSMEFLEIKNPPWNSMSQNFPWSSMENFPWNSMSQTQTEFHGVP